MTIVITDGANTASITVTKGEDDVITDVSAITYNNYRGTEPKPTYVKLAESTVALLSD